MKEIRQGLDGKKILDAQRLKKPASQKANNIKKSLAVPKDSFSSANLKTATSNLKPMSSPMGLIKAAQERAQGRPGLTKTSVYVPDLPSDTSSIAKTYAENAANSIFNSFEGAAFETQGASASESAAIDTAVSLESRHQLETISLMARNSIAQYVDAEVKRIEASGQAMTQEDQQRISAMAKAIQERYAQMAELLKEVNTEAAAETTRQYGLAKPPENKKKEIYTYKAV